MIDTIIAAGILAGFFVSIALALHYAAKARQQEKCKDAALKAVRQLSAQKAQLLADLEKAQRNDSPKDPVTGRFVPRS